MAKTTKRYVTPDNPVGFTPSQFKRLSRQAKLEVMETWFRWNYEDPVHRTPYESAEGGYIYVFGGPFQAQDVLDEEFGDIASESLISELVDNLETECHEWTHTDAWDDPYGDEPEADQGDLLERVAERLARNIQPHFGDGYERQGRKAALDALAELREELDRQRAIGIGHNNPPEDIAEHLPAEDQRALSASVSELQGALEVEKPNLALVVEQTSALRVALGKLLGWVGKKIDKGVDEFVSTVAKGFGVAALAKAAGVYDPMVEYISKAYYHLTHWLDAVTLPF